MELGKIMFNLNNFSKLKKWFNDFARKRSIASTLNWLILPILIVTMLIFGEAVVQIYKNVISEYVRNELQSLTDSSAMYLNNFLSEAMRQSYYIYSNQSLKTALQEIDEMGEHVPIQKTMEFYNDVANPLFSALNNPYLCVNRIYLLDENLHADRSFIRYLDQLPAGIPEKEVLENRGTYIWSLANEKDNSASKGSRRDLLCLTRMLTTFSGKPVAILNTEIDIATLESNISRVVQQRGVGSAYLWSMPDGTVIIQDKEFDDSYWIAEGIVESNNSVLKIAYSTDLIQQQAKRQHFALIGLSLLMTLLAFTAIYFVSHLSLGRLKQVTGKFAASDLEGHIEISAVLYGKDEAAKLDQILTDLYLKYQRNVDAYYRLENAYHVMEYQMLMSKINPHFLYNTLSAIRWSVLSDDKEEAASGVDHLVSFYRGVLSRGRDMIALRLEIATLSEYIQLQSYAYSRQLILLPDLTTEASDCFILKFLLQPVIENAILYSNQEQECRIEINAWKEGEELRITIWNNGPPIREEVKRELNKLNELDAKVLSELTVSQNEKDSYGIYNVISRIRLLFGEKYGLWYSVPLRGGTLAEFRLPFISSPDSWSFIAERKL